MMPPEYNVTGHDYAMRDHLAYRGPILDFHAHVMVTRPGDPVTGPPTGEGPGASTDQAALMLDVGREFGVGPTVSMCLPDDIPDLRERFGDQLLFNGPIQKKKRDDPDDDAYRLLDRYLELGAVMIKFWSAPRGRERGLFVDAPWRIEAAKRARAAGIRLVMVHVGDPDAWFRTVYADAAKFGAKPDQYVRFRQMLELFPDMKWIGAHMGGDVEHPDHLESLLETYPHLYLDTSATKWQVREAPPRRQAVRRLFERFPDRFLFGTDLVTRHALEREHYVSRYWCQRTLWESEWRGPSPIADPDYGKPDGGPEQPTLHGIGLTGEVLDKVYWKNAAKLLGINVRDLLHQPDG
jgi:predicted TIM-barrel fold metal-dependent hydrolase